MLFFIFLLLSLVRCSMHEFPNWWWYTIFLKRSHSIAHSIVDRGCEPHTHTVNGRSGATHRNSFFIRSRRFFLLPFFVVALYSHLVGKTCPCKSIFSKPDHRFKWLRIRTELEIYCVLQGERVFTLSYESLQFDKKKRIFLVICEREKSSVDCWHAWLFSVLYFLELHD